MKKIIMIFLALGLSAFGMSYEKFKKHTLKHSKILKSQELALQKTQQKNNILLRTSNPILTLEGSRFDAKVGNNDFGYAVTASQTIRTGNYMDGLEQQANASSVLSQAYLNQGRAGYIKTLEELYTQYVFQNKMLALLQQEHRLSKDVTQMVKERYQSGSENKVAYLQARTETLTLKTQMYTTKQEQNTLYYQLLAMGGFGKKVALEKRFIYSVSPRTKNISKLSPAQQILNAKEKMNQSNYSISQSAFRSYELFGGIEKEPEQSILRVGINIPLTLHNDRSEERMLAKLQMQQTQLDNEQLAINTQSQKQMIKSAIKELSGQYHALKSLQKEQQELTALLQDGYKIAKGSLFQLMTAKNKLIQTKKALLKTQKIINSQKIALRFLQGDYND